MSELRGSSTESGQALQNSYTFWYHRRRGDKKNVDYNESTKQIESFGTVQAFWQIYDHIVRPNEFKVTTDYHLFKKGIKPTWEDPANNNGGKWMVRLKKGLASRYWEELILAIIGEQFDAGEEICGAVVSVRTSEDIISIWNQNSDNKEATNKIRDQMRRILNLPSFIPIEYKKHVDAKADGSSFRNPSMVYKASTRSSEGNANNGNFNKERPQGSGAGGHTNTFEKRFSNREGRTSGWKDKTDRNTDRNDSNNQSTGDPARDAANADRAKERRHVPATSSWGSSNRNEPRNNDRSTARRERTGSGEIAPENSSPRSDNMSTFKRAPLPGIPSLRTSKPKEGGENPNVWTRARTSDEKD
jgi:translation initiation factor 4E